MTAVTIEPGEWSDACAAWLFAAVDRKREALIDLEADVRLGTATLLRVLDGARLVGAVVLRIDHLASGAQGVIVAAGGRMPGARLTSLLPHIERRFQGVKSIRVHTSRPGMGRVLRRAGYRPQEIVLVKPCSATA